MENKEIWNPLQEPMEITSLGRWKTLNYDLFNEGPGQTQMAGLVDLPHGNHTQHL